MDFLKKVGSTAESLLDQVDQKTAEITKDVRSGNRAARMVAERLEKRERINIEEGSVIGSDVAKKIERMQADLDAAGEVLQRSQQLAAERELKLTGQLERERQDREKREEELMGRIRQLEGRDKLASELEEYVEKLKLALDDAHGSRDQDTVELQAQAEADRLAAEHARQALATTIKDSESRIGELEKANIELMRELAELKQRKDETGGGFLTTATEDERRLTRAMQDLEDRLVAAEDKRSSLELQLGSERARSERLENELRKASAAAMEMKDNHMKQLLAVETKVVTLKQEVDEARTQAETLKRSNLDNGREALEKRLESLSSHLELKQRQIDSLRSEKRALEQRVNETSSMPVLRPTSLGPSAVGELKGRFIRLKIDSSRYKTVAHAVDWIDGLTLSAAAVMRAQPVVRFGFIAYLVLLQLWVFHVIHWTSTPSSSPASMPQAQLIGQGTCEDRWSILAVRLAILTVPFDLCHDVDLDFNFVTIRYEI